METRKNLVTGTSDIIFFVCVDLDSLHCREGLCEPARGWASLMGHLFQLSLTKMAHLQICHPAVEHPQMCHQQRLSKVNCVVT